MIFVAVALGGALGAVGRYWLCVYLVPITGNQFPWGTLFVNMSGCLLIGFLYSLIGGSVAEKIPLTPYWRAFLTTGFLGGLTTFSTFSLESIVLWQQVNPAVALMYVVSSLIGCLGLVIVGLWLATKFI
jgi:CrcB protein